MQSTGIWTFDDDAIKQLVSHTAAVGFSHLEIGGGQSYQIALGQGYNPYRLLRLARDAVDDAGTPVPLQILMRGANQLGFKHYPPAVQKRNIDLLVEAGSRADKATALIIRNFDALNDFENLRYSLDYMVRKDLQAAAENEMAIAAGKPPTAKRLHVQAALSYVRKRSDDENAFYGVRYFVEYAKKLIEIAENAGGQLDSLCIKDMSGQLAPDVARALVPALKQLGLPVYLHCHSTDEPKSTASQIVAVEAGIDGIEVAVSPLAGGTSHNDVDTVSYLDHVVPLNRDAIQALKQTSYRLFIPRIAERFDLGISLGALKRMVKIRVPGGAIPFILKDLGDNVCKVLGVSVEEALSLFEAELTRIQQQLGFVPLVTPTADIIAKQTINNLGNTARPAAYRVVDPRFCSLVLGHYGRVNNYATGEPLQPAGELIDDVIEYCSNIDIDEDGLRVKAGVVYPQPEILDVHPTTRVVEEDSELIEDYIAELFRRYPESCRRYGSEEECFVLHVMRPAGKTDRLLTRNILGPTEDRLRFVLDATLHLLPGRGVPESRDDTDREATDNLLLDAMGDYEGVVDIIKDLVLSGTKESIRQRLHDTMQQIIDPLSQVNDDIKTHRYYVERRFVSLFASAVFWDLQRICRRTGSDSRTNIDERTAFKLEQIISFTLRKRHIEGKGKARRFAS